jgi:hypothetical protein
MLHDPLHQAAQTGAPELTALLHNSRTAKKPDNSIYTATSR